MSNVAQPAETSSFYVAMPMSSLGSPSKNATKTIPIVTYSAGDVVGTGLVASLSRPGGNITGFSFLLPEIEIKRVELLRELVPGLLRIGVLETANLYLRARRKEFEQACRTLGVQPIFFEVATQADVERAITEMARRGAQALMVPQEPLFFENPVPLMTLASRYALPTVTANGNIVDFSLIRGTSKTSALRGSSTKSFAVPSLPTCQSSNRRGSCSLSTLEPRRRSALLSLARYF